MAWSAQTASESDLLEEAACHHGACFAEGEPGYCEPGLATWRYVERFDLSCLADQTDWVEWFKQEQQWAKNDGRNGYDDMLDREIVEEIVVLVRDGKGYIWDGNHRVGAAFTRGQTHLKAIVGVPIPELESEIIPVAQKRHTSLSM